MKRSSLAVLAVSVAIAGLELLACGKDVDLGGTTESELEGGAASIDAATRDAWSDVFDDDTEDLAEDCEPCVLDVDCRDNERCTQISVDAGNTYCVALCTLPSDCEPDETCRQELTANSDTALVCAPLVGVCPLAASPSGPDGGVLDRCGKLVGPHVTASCRDCRYECQDNGCYSGWWCNTETRECVRPPKTCP